MRRGDPGGNIAHSGLTRNRSGLNGYFAITSEKEVPCPASQLNVKNEKQYEALKDKGMSKERAAKIANSPEASKHGGQKCS